MARRRLITGFRARVGVGGKRSARVGRGDGLDCGWCYGFGYGDGDGSGYGRDYVDGRGRTTGSGPGAGWGSFNGNGRGNGWWGSPILIEEDQRGTVEEDARWRDDD